MSAYIYSRQSSGNSEQSTSIDQQVENCKQLAEKEGWKVNKVFKDYNTSGRLYWIGAEQLASIDITYQNWLKETKKTGSWRIGLGNLLDELNIGDTIIVDDKTRLARSLNGSYLENALIQILKSKQIKLFSVKEGQINFDDFGQTLVFNLQSSINSNQLETQRKKCKDSLKRLKDDGSHIQAIQTTMGYKSTGKKFEYEINPTQAEVVKLIYKQFLAGKSYLSIAKELNEKYSSCFNTGHICIATIKHILKRPLYAGYYYNSNNQLVKAKEIEGKELVSFSDWKTVNEILNKRKTHKVPVKKNIYFFNGITKCGYCGDTMTIVINNKKYFSLRCKSHQTIKKENCSVSIGQNSDFENGLGMNSAIEPLLCLGLLKKLNDQQNQVEIKDKIEAKIVDLNNLTSKEKQLTDMFFDGVLSEDALKDRLTQNKVLKQKIQAELIELQNQTTEVDEDELRAMTSKIFNRKLTNEEYTELVHQTLKEIKVFHNKIQIETYFGDIELPRKRLNGWYKLPKYIWSNEPGHYKLYYYYKAPNIYGKKQKLFDNKELAIYFIEDTQ